MPGKPSLEQRVRWHVAHARACGCRPMPKSVVAAVRKGERSPVVVVQWVRVEWTKGTRGAPGAVRRAGAPRAFPLPPERAAFLTGRHYFRDRIDGSLEPGLVDYMTRASCPDHQGPLLLRWEDGDLVVGFRWKDETGKPFRRDKADALRIRSGQTGRLVVNGRHSTHDDQYYSQDTYNVALGVDIDDDVFVKGRPNRSLNLEADLW
jgi:hypothetical protein